MQFSKTCGFAHPAFLPLRFYAAIIAGRSVVGFKQRKAFSVEMKTKAQQSTVDHQMIQLFRPTFSDVSSHLFDVSSHLFCVRNAILLSTARIVEGANLSPWSEHRDSSINR